MKRCKPYLGTYVEIDIIDASQTTNLQHAMTEAYQVIHKISNLMSFHLRQSDLTKLNQFAYERPVIVDAMTYEVLALAKDLFTYTGGSFDCAVAQHLQVQGLLPHFIDMKSANVQAAHNPCHDLAHLILTNDCTVSFSKPLLVDLGGIAKGYAVDRACEVLISCGVTAACVNAGGDLRVLGEQQTDIHIRHPLQPQHLIYAGQLRNGALASSASYFTEQGSTSKSALVDPRTGGPILTSKSFSVIAPTCAVADGLVKALAVDQDLSASYFKHYGAQPLIV